MLCGYFEHQRRVQFEGCAAEPLHSIRAILPGSKWSCLLLRIVLQGAYSDELQKIYPPLKNGKEGKSKISSEDELSQCSKEGESDDGRQCRNAWSGFDNKSQEVGSERKSEEKEVQSEILAHKEEQSLPKELHEGGVKKLLRAGMMPARTWGVHAVGNVSH